LGSVARVTFSRAVATAGTDDTAAGEDVAGADGLTLGAADGGGLIDGRG